MNFAALRVAAAQQCSLGTNDPLYGAIDSRINAALHAVENEAPDGWDWMVTDINVAWSALAESQTFFELDDDIVVTKVRGVDVQTSTDPVTLGRYARAELRARLSTASPQAIPLAYAVEGQNLYLVPAPSVALQLTVSVVQSEPDLAADEDEPLLPARFHGAVLAKTCELLQYDLGNPTKASARRSEYGDEIGRLRRSARPSTGSSRITRVGR